MPRAKAPLAINSVSDVLGARMQYADNKKLGLSEAVDSVIEVLSDPLRFEMYRRGIYMYIYWRDPAPIMVQTTVVSAPGKVLIAGGYLVLDPAYSGIVVSTSSRFYTAISDQPSHKPGVVRVRSPQFLEAIWLFSVSLDPDVAIKPLEEKY